LEIFAQKITSNFFSICQFEDEVSNAIEKAIREIQKNNETAFVLESLQYELKCCGWKNGSDYHTEAGYKEDQVPGSCCGNKPPSPTCTYTTNPNSYANVGCESKLHFTDIQHLFTSTIAVGVAIIMFELILVFAACCLAREIRY